MAGEAKKLFAASEVALHASRKDCWVVIGGKASEKEIFLAVLLLVLWGTKREIWPLIRFGRLLIILLDGWFQVYDVTKFLEDHPGGEDVLLHASGSKLSLSSLP